MCVRRERRLRAAAFGAYPNVTAAARTAARVGSPIRGSSWRARDAVDSDVSAARATSASVTRGSVALRSSATGDLLVQIHRASPFGGLTGSHAIGCAGR